MFTTRTSQGQVTYDAWNRRRLAKLQHAIPAVYQPRLDLLNLCHRIDKNAVTLVEVIIRPSQAEGAHPGSISVLHGPEQVRMALPMGESVYPNPAPPRNGANTAYLNLMADDALVWRLDYPKTLAPSVS